MTVVKLPSRLLAWALTALGLLLLVRGTWRGLLVASDPYGKATGRCRTQPLADVDCILREGMRHPVDVVAPLILGGCALLALGLIGHLLVIRGKRCHAAGHEAESEPRSA